MARKFVAPILLGAVTILALLLLTGGTKDRDILEKTFQIDAVYDSGSIEIAYLDKSGKTISVVLEILGMEESFQKTFSGPEFTEAVPFPNTPKYGWKIHPIVLEIDHDKLGHIQIKTEIRPVGQPAPDVIYSRP